MKKSRQILALLLALTLALGLVASAAAVDRVPKHYDTYTVAIGLFSMLDKEHIDIYFRQFAAGSVLVAVPIMALFMSLQRYYVEGVTGGAVKG